MEDVPATPGPDLLLRTLAEFRYELRRFLHFSECAALDAGLQPQQHQLLLQVAGAPQDTAVTISYAAERLGLKHNSAVELVDRSEREGLRNAGLMPMTKGEQFCESRTEANWFLVGSQVTMRKN